MSPLPHRAIRGYGLREPFVLPLVVPFSISSLVGVFVCLFGHAQPVAQTGTVECIVTFAGNLPLSSIPDDTGARRPLLEVDAGKRGLRHVVAFLTPIDGTKPPTETRGDASIPAVTVDQRDHTFVPRVVAVRAGQSVTFTNSDAANHNVRASSPVRANEFNVYTGADGRYVHRFAADPEPRPVRLGCDIHPWMQGWVYVFDHPRFAISDAQGRLRIDFVPPGRYTLSLRQPDVRYATDREITLPPSGVVRQQIEVRLPETPQETRP